MTMIAEFVDVCRQLRASRSLHIALMMIVPYACVLVGLDVAAHYGDATGAALPVQFFMSQDRSFAEYLEYSLTASSAILLFVLWFRCRTPLFMASAILFVWMTLDNSVEIHEQLGFVIGAWLPTIAWLPVQPHHLAETLVFGVVGSIWLVGMLMALRRADERSAIYGILILSGIVGAAMFGVVVDLATSWGDHGQGVLNIFAFVEDEGEFAMTLLLFALTVGIYDLERPSKVRGDSERPRPADAANAVDNSLGGPAKPSQVDDASGRPVQQFAIV